MAVDGLLKFLCIGTHVINYNLYLCVIFCKQLYWYIIFYYVLIKLSNSILKYFLK